MNYGNQANNLYGSAISGVEQQLRSAEIPSYTDQLCKALQECAGALTALDERLACVSRTDPPMTDAKQAVPVAVPQSNLGTRLRDMLDMAETIIARVQGMTRRLEV